MEVRTRHGTVLPGEVYGGIDYWTEHEYGFARINASLFLRKLYNGSVVVNCESCERSSVILQSVILKPIFGHDFLVVAQHYVMAVISVIEVTLEDVDVEAL